ncbi:protein of unknown function [Lactobacillus delbrueckii subsp. delbrueckii]|uniref:Phosphotransferase system EIIC domain-containing protein n=1 Tax=Lactobacillus delbrueckii subsp. delbrueckii TaxID=83684 RepID=A0AAU9R2X5_9LACO|nr:hypothetical protein [Lactobacillus delbrueckii]CAH1706729.1 protein of unknown function [Lactobacillus delbrueckii subsp. delbrueckii]
MTESKETNGLKQGTLNILNGIGLGVIAALVPAAILGQLMKALLGVAPSFAQTVINITTFTANFPGFYNSMSKKPTITAFFEV